MLETFRSNKSNASSVKMREDPFKKRQRDIAMLHHRQRLKQIQKQDVRSHVANAVYNHIESVRMPYYKDRIKQQIKNDEIYRENLRIYKNINSIMNRRSTSVAASARDRSLVHTIPSVEQLPGGNSQQTLPSAGKKPKT